MYEHTSSLLREQLLHWLIVAQRIKLLLCVLIVANTTRHHAVLQRSSNQSPAVLCDIYLPLVAWLRQELGIPCRRPSRTPLQ